ncbi:MAG: FAD-dependent oxidoreductase, partial [Bacteroidetes bacterium]|nr:FAD-dependent oxidoreductase [Bacteroidota bacterium]
INPVTGRRLVTTWMIDELLAVAREAYGRLEEELGGLEGKAGAEGGLGVEGRAGFFEPVRVVDFFPTAQMRLAFLKRLEEEDGGLYLRLPEDERVWGDSFHYELGYGEITPCYLVDMPGLLEAARKRWREKGVLWEERFGREELEVGDEGVKYREVRAGKVVFCDGVESFESPYFSRLPFAPNKGEALIIEVDGLGERAVFKKGMSLAPWREGLYWVGSSYEWEFTEAGPTEGFRERTEAVLREWLKLPFKVVEHLASVRPATLERRPFVGFHPLYPAVGILNGMGTKGCSLAPYFARQLVENVRIGAPILPTADVRRFTRILSRG